MDRAWRMKVKVKRRREPVCNRCALSGSNGCNRQPKNVGRESTMDKAKGKAKEAAGAMKGNEDKKAEGRAQQRKGEAREEAAQKEKTRREQAEAKQAEKDRDRESRKGKGPLGGVTDTLSGR